jgi:hypothetical protein
VRAGRIEHALLECARTIRGGEHDFVWRKLA